VHGNGEEGAGSISGTRGLFSERLLVGIYNMSSHSGSLLRYQICRSFVVLCETIHTSYLYYYLIISLSLSLALSICHSIPN
jgi:hypothetical protein